MNEEMRRKKEGISDPLDDPKEDRTKDSNAEQSQGPQNNVEEKDSKSRETVRKIYERRKVYDQSAHL